MQYGRYEFIYDLEFNETSAYMKCKIEVLNIVPEDDLEIPNNISTIGIMYELKKVK